MATKQPEWLEKLMNIWDRRNTAGFYELQELFEAEKKKHIRQAQCEAEERGQEKLLTLEFSVDRGGTPQIIESWNYNKENMDKFSKLQMMVMISGLLEEKRKNHKKLLPLLERFARVFLEKFRASGKEE